MGKKMSIELTDQPKNDLEFQIVRILDHALLIAISITLASTIIPEEISLPYINPIKFTIFTTIYITIYLTLNASITKIFPQMPL